MKTKKDIYEAKERFLDFSVSIIFKQFFMKF